jgi:protein phosphatase
MERRLPMTELPTGEPLPPTAAADPTVPSTRVRVDVAARTHQGHVRKNNEDSYVIYRLGRFLEPLSSSIPTADLPPASQDVGYLMIVADGLGGHQGGEVASRTALVSALELILRSPQWALKLDDPATRENEISNMQKRSEVYLSRVHEMIRRQAEAQPELSGMGTTLTGAWSVGLDLFLLHVGDSRAYVLHRNRLRKLTRDHTVAQDYADQGMIQQHEVKDHRLHHVLTRAIGASDRDVHGDMHHMRLAPGDRVLLCSDGLTDMVTEPEIAQVLRAGLASENAAQTLVDMALAQGGKDNVTALVAGYSLGA